MLRRRNARTARLSVSIVEQCEHTRSFSGRCGAAGEEGHLQKDSADYEKLGIRNNNITIKLELCKFRKIVNNYYYY